MKRLDIEDVDVQGDMTAKEQEETIRQQAGCIMEGIIAAAQNLAEETKEITITRNGRPYFRLVIRPISEMTAKDLRKKCTKYAKNKAYGVRVPEETDMTRYRSMLVYEATVNREETWDSRILWKALESRYPIIQGWETVDQVLLAGEKDRIVDEINELSGYIDEDEEDEEKLEETIKN